jgi:thiol-disulfide isomerase/thioredoxin
MTPQEQIQIRDWHSTRLDDIEIKIVLSDHPQSQAVREFCTEFSRVAHRIGFRTTDVETGELPGIHITPRLVFHAAPQGSELDPFLEAINMFHPGDPPVQSSKPTHDLNPDLPVFLKLFVAPQCPFCPIATRQFLPLVRANANLNLAIIDSLLFEDDARQFAIQSVPTLLMDNDYRWTGPLPIAEIIQLINNRDPATLGVDSLRNLLEQGRADQLTSMMIKDGSIFPAFFDLLTHSKWPVRLGAMVVIETLCEQDPELAQQVVAPLQAHFNKVDPMAQGDILHTIGQAGDVSVVPWLDAIGTQSNNPEIKESVHEAVLAIKTRSAHANMSSHDFIRP